MLLPRIEIPVLSESWRGRRQINQATFDILVRPESELLHAYNRKGGTRWTAEGSKGQFAFLYSLRIYQNYAINELIKMVQQSGIRVSKEWAIQQAQIFKEKMPYLKFSATTEFTDILVNYMKGEVGAALIAQAYAGNCYFDIHDQGQAAGFPEADVLVAA